MEELGQIVAVLFVIVLLVVFVASCITYLNETGISNSCRDYGYPDAAFVNQYGWYCVGIDKELDIPFLVEFEIATRKD